ncbi:hypothetical protein [Desertibacillus haloalkaliphilus]|uniref:hypothetical protein n=1 Tax=Desertibacillus haloalkaliphilus TaxID=1328930 RepID=UPI001C26982E|nr:hypothetical protein [Desertibacillus haloalkaliphilus]MBU8908164.1 hypothetical protein [Desertibacillus haloalkaliphilus]
MVNHKEVVMKEYGIKEKDILPLVENENVESAFLINGKTSYDVITVGAMVHEDVSTNVLYHFSKEDPFEAMKGLYQVLSENKQWVVPDLLEHMAQAKEAIGELDQHLSQIK